MAQNKSLAKLIFSWSLICGMFTFILFLYFRQSNNYVKFEPKI